MGTKFRKDTENSLKRYLKGKAKITLGLIVSFMISGNIAYGEIIDNEYGQTVEAGTYDYKVELGKDKGKGNIVLKPDGGKYNYTFNEGIYIDNSKNYDDYNHYMEHNHTITVEFSEADTINPTELNINIGKGKEFKVIQNTGNIIGSWGRVSQDPSNKSELNINDENNKNGNLVFINGHMEGSDGTSNTDAKTATISDVYNLLDINIYAESLYIGLDKNIHDHGSIGISGKVNIGLSGDLTMETSQAFQGLRNSIIDVEGDINIDSTFASEEHYQYGFLPSAIDGGDNTVIKGNNINIKGNGIIETDGGLSINAKNDITFINESENWQQSIIENTGRNENGKGKLDITAEGNIHLIDNKDVDSKIAGKNINMTSGKDFIMENITLNSSDSTFKSGDNSGIIISLDGLDEHQNLPKAQRGIISFKNPEGNVGEIALEGGYLDFRGKKHTHISAYDEGGKVAINTGRNYIETTTIEAGNKGEVNFKSDKNIIKADVYTKDDGVVNINFDGDGSVLTGNSYYMEGERFFEFEKYPDRNYSERVEGGIINLGFTNGAVWEVTKAKTDYKWVINFKPTDIKLEEDIPADVKVTNLHLDNGIVKLNHEKGGQTFLAENLKGKDGVFQMDISVNDIDNSKGETDFLKIKDGEVSKHYIEIGTDSVAGIKNHDFEDGKNAIWIADSHQNITFEGKEFTNLSNIYSYEVELDKNTENSTFGNNWYITGVKEKESPVTESIIDDMSFLYNAASSRIELDNIHKRIGDIREYKDENGVWFRTSGGKLKSDTADSSFKNDYYVLQVGFDKKQISEKGDWFTGFAVNRRENDTDFRNGDGKSENIGLSLYRSFAGKDNSYFDLIGKYTYIDSEYNAYNENSKMSADYDTWAGSISMEYGKKYSNKNDKWYITPHAQLNYTYINGADYTTSTDVKVEQDNIDSLIGKAGVYLGKDFEKSSHYLSLSAYQEFLGDYGAEMKGADTSVPVHKKVNGEDSWIEAGIGGNFQVGESGTTHVYYDIERTFGSDFETQWQGTVGFRISFDKISDLFEKNPKPQHLAEIKADSHFDFGKSELKDSGKEKIKEVSKVINEKNLKGTLLIEGHTDWTGSEEYNQLLSEKRARAVQEIFEENITNENIKYETKGYGETKPIEDNRTSEGRAANRRVDTSFQKN